MASKWKTLPFTLPLSSKRPFSKSSLYQNSVYISIFFSSQYIITTALNYYVSRIKQGISQNTIIWTSHWTRSYKETINTSMQDTQHARLIQYVRDNAWRHHRLGFILRLLQKLVICNYIPNCIIRLRYCLYGYRAVMTGNQRSGVTHPLISKAIWTKNTILVLV
jgi:hypothetical protein